MKSVRIIPVLLCLVLSLGATAVAVDSRNANASVNLMFHQTTATCTAVCKGSAPEDKMIATLTLYSNGMTSSYIPSVMRARLAEESSV